MSGGIFMESNKKANFYSTKESIDSNGLNEDFEVEVVLKKYKGNDVDVIIPEGITTIGTFAFNDCKRIKSIKMPQSVTFIDERAFEGCSSLTSIDIPCNVKSIIQAFDFCPNLANITVDPNNGCYSSEDGVLFNKDKTELIKYPEGKPDYEYSVLNSVRIIDDYAFSSCKTLVMVTLHNGVEKIGAGAFSDCPNLKSVTMSNSVKYIGNFAFNKCKNLMNVDIPEGITEIQLGAFSGCTNLVCVNIPDSVTKICQCAFKGCENLKSITISNNIEYISEDAFEGCTSLIEVSVPVEFEDCFKDTPWYNNRH